VVAKVATKTTAPVVDRLTLSDHTSQVMGFLDDENSGAIVYVYLNTKRVATVFTILDSNGRKRWRAETSDFAFGGGVQHVKSGDHFYFQAKAVGKDKSDPTKIYTVLGIDQPDTPYTQADLSQPLGNIYESERYLVGDVPLFNGTDLFMSDISNNVEEGVTVSVYVNGTFLGITQSDRTGHWTFDTLSVPDSPLLPLTKNDRVTARAIRYAVNPADGLKTEVLVPSAESQPAIVLGNFYTQRLFDFLPAQMQTDDKISGDLQVFTKILGMTMDEVKSFIDQFTDIFDIDRCDTKYFDALAYLLGYPLNKQDSFESQRFQLKNAVELWKRKGTFEVFRILFYLLDFDITITELWTEDYALFFPTIMASNRVDYLYYDDQNNPLPPPDTAPELLENGGTWYKSPYFGIHIDPLVQYTPTPGYPYKTDPVACPMESNTFAIAFSPEDLKYLLERVDYFRPAHTVLDYIAFMFPIFECGPIPDDPMELDVDWYPQDPGWYAPYCLPDDPIYYRDGHHSTRPDGKGTLDLGVMRDLTGLHPSTDPTINMKRLPERGYCHPGEILEFASESDTEEPYYFTMLRNGFGMSIADLAPDMNDWPSRDPYDPPLRDGKYRYASRLLVYHSHLEMLHNFFPSTQYGVSPRSSLVQSSEDGYLYGVTSAGGLLGYGMVFKFDLDGNLLDTYNFGTYEARDVQCGLTEAPEPGIDPLRLYGASGVGGSADAGCVFKINRTPMALTVLHSFQLGNEGYLPSSSLVYAVDGYLYGVCAGGGPSGQGTVFRILGDGTDFSVVHAFGADGVNSSRSLMQASNGHFYGTDAVGNVFKMDGTTFAITVLATGLDTPYGTLVEYSGFLYGVTSAGGTNGRGLFYKVELATGAYTAVSSFPVSPGPTQTFAFLALASAGLFYGVSTQGGSGNDGVVFSVNTAGTITTLESFMRNITGFSSKAGLLKATNGSFYGVTPVATLIGGSYGTLFRFLY